MLSRLWLLPRLGFLFWALLPFGSTLRAQEPNPPAFASSEKSPADAKGNGPIYLFQNGPLDIDSLRRRMNRPDLVVLEGDSYLLLQQAAAAPSSGDGAPPSVLESLTVRGRYRGALAFLTLEFRLTLSGQQEFWAPLGLVGQVVVRARESGQDRALRQTGPQAGWEVRLLGPGTHEVGVELVLPVRSEGNARRLELPIPVVAATRLEFLVPEGRVSAASLGPGEPVVIEDQAEVGSWLRATLSARNRLDLSWQTLMEEDNSGPPVLTVQGEIAMDVDRGRLSTRSNWSIRCDRGTLDRLLVQLADIEEEILSAELDGLAIPSENLRNPESGLVTLPLGTPLEPVERPTCNLTMTTRRALPVAATTRVPFRGYAFQGATAQSGAISIAHAEDLWLSGTPGRALRQINPLTDLPEGLRQRPGISLAYQFLDQPFDLELRVDPSPPSLQASGRSTIQLDATGSRLETEFLVRASRGRVPELQVEVPEGLVFEQVGPRDVVAGSQLLEDRGASVGVGARQVLSIRLTPEAMAQEEFRLRLQGRQSLDQAQENKLSLFQPKNASIRGGVIAVLTSREVSPELWADSGDSLFQIMALGPESTESWPWPTDRLPGAPALWLRYEGAPEAVPLRVVIRPKTVYHSTSVIASVDRRRLETAQSVMCHVRNGSLTYVEVLVPGLLEEKVGRWGLEGGEVSDLLRLGQEADGSVKYRLSLTREIIDSVSLNLWCRIPMEPELSADRVTRMPVPVIRVLGGQASPLSVALRADPGIRLEVSGDGWVSPRGDTLPPETGNEGGLPIRWSWTGPEESVDSPAFGAKAPLTASLPDLLVSRAWVHTILGSDKSARTDAWMRLEVHQGSLQILLPKGAAPEQVWVGDDPVEMQRLTESNSFRIRIPQDMSGPVLVGVSYSQKDVNSLSEIPAPRLQASAVVQTILWEVSIPWTRVFIGTPPGWNDENRWQWTGYALKRRPSLSKAEIADWLSGGNSSSRLSRWVEARDALGTQGYLFSHAGAPESLRLLLLSRALLVALCSGLALCLGLCLLFSGARAPALWVSLLGILFTIATAWDPAAAFLILESSLAGLGLIFVAALTRRIVERRRSAAGVAGDSPSAVHGMERGARGSSMRAVVVEPGTEESTVIRPRPVTSSTLDVARPGRPESDQD